MARVNPKCKIEAAVKTQACAPKVEVQFVDDSVLQFDTHDMAVVDIMSEVHKKSYVLEDEYDMAGKNIDDLM